MVHITKSLHILFIISFLSIGNPSQNLGQAYSRGEIRVGGGRIDGLSTSNASQNAASIIGSEYLTPIFIKGKIVKTDQSSDNTHSYRYNIYRDQMEFIEGTDTLAIISPFKVTNLSFGRKTFIYCLKKERNNGLSAGYLEILVDGDLQLLIRRQKKVETNSYVSNYMGGGGDGREYYVTRETFYLRKPGGAAWEIKQSRFSVIKNLKDKKQEIADYIKDKNIKFFTNQNMVDIVLYYNSLKNPNYKATLAQRANGNVNSDSFIADSAAVEIPKPDIKIIGLYIDERLDPLEDTVYTGNSKFDTGEIATLVLLAKNEGIGIAEQFKTDIISDENPLLVMIENDGKLEINRKLYPNETEELKYRIAINKLYKKSNLPLLLIFKDEKSGFQRKQRINLKLGAEIPNVLEINKLNK